jgi:hypothetical protein
LQGVVCRHHINARGKTVPLKGVCRCCVFLRRRPMRLGGGLGGDSRLPKEPRKKILAEAAARGVAAPPAADDRPIRYSMQRFGGVRQPASRSRCRNHEQVFWRCRCCVSVASWLCLWQLDSCVVHMPQRWQQACSQMGAMHTAQHSLQGLLPGARCIYAFRGGSQTGCVT